MEENKDLFGNPVTEPARSMSDYFGVPPLKASNGQVYTVNPNNVKFV